MPELPEVETIKRTLNVLVPGKTIERVSVLLPRIIIKPDDIEMFKQSLVGHTFASVERKGKFLRFMLDGIVLVSHLRMEGRYGLYSSDEPVEKHTHVMFHFTDGTELRYKDVRQFGTMHLFAPDQDLVEAPLVKVGLEPLDPSFTLEAFKSAVAMRKSKIKPVLLNQAYVAGLGNIYVDEALFTAGIHPERNANTLSHKELQALHNAIIQTLRAAVAAGGTSIKSYVNGQGEIGMFQHELKIYGKQAEACIRCGQTIAKTVVGGRGTHICLHCQPLQ